MEKSSLKNMKFGKEKLKNIWFYYKWYILAGVFLLVVGIALVVQCASKKDADLYIYWAGPVYLQGDAQTAVCEAFDAAIPDEYGKRVALVTTVYGEDVKVNGKAKENEQVYYDYIGQKATLEELKTQLRMPNTVICLLSPACYKAAVSDGETLIKIAEVLDETPEGLTADGYGIPLSSLPFYESNSALKHFPEDTLLCVKSASIFRGAGDYERALGAFRALCAFGK